MSDPRAKNDSWSDSLLHNPGRLIPKRMTQVIRIFLMNQNHTWRRRPVYYSPVLEQMTLMNRIFLSESIVYCSIIPGP